MGSPPPPPPCFLKHPVVAIGLSFLLLCFCSFYSYLFGSIFVTLLVLVLSASFLFISSKLKQLLQASLIKKPVEMETNRKILPENDVLEQKKATREEANVTQMNGSVLKSPEKDELSLKNSNKILQSSDNSIANDKSLPEDMGQIPLACLDCSISDDKLSPENADQLPTSSDGSISDDENLIEIALPDGHYVGPEEPNALFQPNLKEFLPDFSPESLFRQHGLMELLSEINEEDNLIEIDIAMGSIKCSRLGIKA